MLATLHDQVDGRYRVLDFSDKSLDYDLENRDLYLLELKADRQQIGHLLAKVNAQIGQTFPYTFAKYNCAYYLALLLEEQGFMVKSVASQIYVEPVDLMKAVRGETAGSITFIPSSHRVLTQKRGKLTQTQWLEFEQFLRGDDAVLTSHNEALNQAVSAYIRYQLPREPEPWRRQHLAASQKRVWHEVLEETASLPGADTNGHYELSISSGGSVGLKFQPELRNFFSMHTPDQAGAYLDLLSVEVTEKKGRFDVSQFTLFKSESIHPESYKSRLLDIAYRNWENKTARSNREAYLTWGMGAAFNFYGVSAALTPNLTLAATNAQDQAINLRLGYRAMTEYHQAAWAVRLQTDRWTHSPFVFSREDTLQIRFKLTPQTNLGWEMGRIPQLDRSFQRVLLSHAI